MLVFYMLVYSVMLVSFFLYFSHFIKCALTYFNFTKFQELGLIKL